MRGAAARIGTCALLAALGVLPSAACGKKGPPLPPLVRLPAAPADMSASRRGADVVLQFTVPAANTDDTRPANISRVDVYAVTAPAVIPDDRLLALGTRVASVAVKSPVDPNRTIDPDESAADMEPLEGDGLDQGTRTRVVERLDASAMTPLDLSRTLERASAEAMTDEDGPLVGPVQIGIATRTYVAVGIDTRGRQGPLSTRVTVPLAPAPAPPSSPTVTYDETSISIAWAAASDPAAGLLPAHPLGVPAATLAYHVYDAPPPDAPPPAPDQTTVASVDDRLTTEPTAETRFTDSRVVWGATRCYGVRTVATIGALAVESDQSPATCVTLADTFAPAAPEDLRGVASEGSISLIWAPNSEPDLAGYLVLRGAPGGALEPVTPDPIKETIFNDAVPGGVRHVYAIAAVDTAGNRSAESNRFEDVSR